MTKKILLKGSSIFCLNFLNMLKISYLFIYVKVFSVHRLYRRKALRLGHICLSVNSKFPYTILGKEFPLGLVMKV